MYSQLVVVDFTKTHRIIPFTELTGITQEVISYYRDDLFDEFSAYLFNYERWGERPLLQLVFWFEDLKQVDDVLKDKVMELNLKYQGHLNTDLVIVEHKDSLTVCGYAPIDKYPDIGNSLSWLVEPTKEKIKDDPEDEDTESEG